MGEVVNCAAYADGRRVADVEITDLDTALKQEDCFLWVGLHEPSEPLLRHVQQAFGLHDLAIEDAHRANEFVPAGDLVRAGAVLEALIARRCLAA